MPEPTVYSLIASPLHPQLGSLYARLGLRHISFTSERKAIQQLKQDPPNAVVADFVYGYGNNYAGVNISNLDVFLYSLQKFAPEAKVIILAEKNERRHVDKLAEIVPVHAVLTYPVGEQEIAPLLVERGDTQ